MWFSRRESTLHEPASWLSIVPIAWRLQMSKKLTHRPAFWGAVLITLIALVGLSPVTGSLSPAQATAPAVKPTVVLVHGAFADASSWDGVISRLERNGYTALAPALPMRGLTSDTTYLRSFLATISGPVVLVGHSYGGAVISNAAADDPNVRALVFVSGFLPQVGESVSDTNAASTLKLLGPDQLQSRPYTGVGGGTGTDLYVNIADFRRVMGADLPAATARLLAATQRPADALAFSEKATEAAWTTIPSWCFVAKQDRAVGYDSERAMAVRAGCHMVEANGSHLVMISKPAAVTHLILIAAQATNT
jgi:pimeloyl-ACP methyl ester carboxylesterase